MKTAVRTAPITQQITTTRVLAVDPDPQARTTPDFWDYIESLKPEDWSEHMVYIYRTDPRASAYGDGQANVDKCPGYITMPDGSQVAFNDREEVERAIMEKHGGKAFRLIVKRRSERVTEGKSSNEAPPKYLHQANPQNSSGVTVSPMSDASATADVAKAAMSAVAGQDRQALSIAVDALRSTAEMVSRLSKSPEGNAGPQDDLTKRVLDVLLMRALEPPDPLEQMTKFFSMMNQFQAKGADPSLPPGSPLNKVMELAIERLLNPVSTVAPVNASAELVRQLPSVAGHVTEAIREWRMGSEAQRDTAAMMANAGKPGVQPPPPGKALPQANVTPMRPIQAAPQNNPQPQEASNVAPAPALEFIEAKIIEIFQEGISAEAAAEECFYFIDRMDQHLIAQLAAAGETGVMTFFNARPVLRPATANVPRLTDFIRAFLKYANESLRTPPADGITMPPGTA